MIGGTVIRGDEMLALGGFLTVVKGAKSDYVGLKRRFMLKMDHGSISFQTWYGFI